MAAVIERTFDRDQLRDPGGEDGGQWVSSPGSAAKDALKLAGKIDLGSDEQLLGSDKLSGNDGAVRIAAIDSGGKRRLRIGIGDGTFGGRDDEAGPWRGNQDSTAQVNAERRKLSDEGDALNDERERLDAASDVNAERIAAIEKRLGEIDEMDEAPVVPSGFTADVAAENLGRFRDDAPEALAKAQRSVNEVNDWWKRRDDLEAQRDRLRGLDHLFTPEEDARWDRLTEQMEALGDEPDWDYEVFAEGAIPGRWADIRYRIELDDLAAGPQLLLAAVPHDNPELTDLDAMFVNDQGATLDPAEAKRLLRLLDKLSTGPAPTTRSTVLRYDADQHRGYHGRWAHVGGFNMDGLTGVTHVEGTFGDLAMGVDPAGDIRVAFREGGEVRELGLSAEDLEDLSSRLFTFSAGRSRIDDEAASDDVVDDDSWGVDQDHRIEMYGSGLISVIFGAEGDDPTTLNLDPPYDADPDDPEDVDFDDVDSLIEGIDEVLAVDPDASRAGRARSIERKYNSAQLRDPGGEDGGRWVSNPGSAAKAAVSDALKLAGKIDLSSDERLVGSAKIDGDQGGIRMALIDRNGNRYLRLGLGPEGYGKRNREEGIAAWDGNKTHEAPSAIEHDRLDAESDALDAEYDTASPERQEEIDARLAELREQLTAAEENFNGTAELDEYSMRRLADRIRPALKEASEQETAELEAYDDLEFVKSGAVLPDRLKDPAELAELERIANRGGSTDYIVFAKGIIPGSALGDVHFSVELDDPTVGVYVQLGVTPKDAGDDWDDDNTDWMATFDYAETRRFLGLLDKFAAAQAQRAYSPERGGTKAAPAGGQFALGGGRVGAQQKSKRQRKPAAKAKPKPAAPAAPAGPLTFDGKRGTGYGVKGGDPRVRTLQSALNRLGLADSSGASLVLDGRYGPRTTSSVKKLQKALGLKPDGTVTPELLKQATELKQLPAKPAAKPRAPRKAKTRRTAAAKRSQVLASVARALGEHYIADGICVACGEPEGDDAVRALVEAFDEIERVRHVRTEAGARKYGLPIGSVIGGGSGSAHAPMVAKAAGAGRTSLTDRLVDALQAHHAGRGAGDPFDGYDREQLRKVAKARGLKLDRGESRESISNKLLDHAGPGRSASEPDATTKVVDRRPAKDISNDVNFKALPASYNPKTGENDALKAIIDRQGFNGRPMVVSAGDFDAALRRGEVRETWRGLRTPARMANASGLAEQFRTGDFHVGHGINGDGTYVAISKGDGEYYGSTLLRIGLRKDARVISADALDREMDSYFAGLKLRHTSAELRRLDEKLLKDLAAARTARGRANIRRTYRNAVDGLDPDRSVALQRDPGIFAALRGYDAIEISKARSPDKHHEMILLNRAATIVQEA